MAPSVPAPWQGRDTFPKGEGVVIRVPNVIRGKISTPSLLGKVAFALQEAKDGRVDIKKPHNAVRLYILDSFYVKLDTPNCSVLPR